jgi:hypothetical protein
VRKKSSLFWRTQPVSVRPKQSIIGQIKNRRTQM